MGRISFDALKRAAAIVAPIVAIATMSPCALAEEREVTAEAMATARDSLREGLTLRESGDLAGALQKFHLAYSLVPTAITAYELGKTHMMMGKILDARELFLTVGRIPHALEETAHSQAARDESAKLAEELEPLIPTLRITVKLNAPGSSAVVSLDGIVIPKEALATARRVNPGSHEIVAKAGDGPEQKVSIDVAKSETKDVALEPVWVAPKNPPLEARPFYIRTSPNPIIYYGIVLTAAGTLSSITMGYFALQFRSDGLNRCQGQFCPPNAARDFNATNGFFVGTLASLAATGCGVGLAILGVLYPRNEKVYAGVTPMVGPGAVGVRGTF